MSCPKASLMSEACFASASGASVNHSLWNRCNAAHATAVSRDDPSPAAAS